MQTRNWKLQWAVPSPSAGLKFADKTLVQEEATMKATVGGLIPKRWLEVRRRLPTYLDHDPRAGLKVADIHSWQVD